MNATHVATAKPIREFLVDSLPVRIYDRQEAMYADIAGEVHEHLHKTLTSKGSAAAILATGNSQIKFLEALIKLGDLDWSRITLFHMDEYLGISGDHKASFRRYMRERVESRVHPKAFHYLEGDSLLPMEECERYGRLLAAQPIDLCCLGVGENGHLAFNDPPVANFSDKRSVNIVALDNACRMQQVNEGHFPDLESVPQYALTLTIPALCSAEKVICLAPEKRKAKPIRAALEDPVSTRCPTSYLRRCQNATLYLDTESSSLLSGKLMHF